MSLYLWVNLCSISIPLLVSFHPRIRLHKHWKAMIASLFITMIPFIVWDVYFTYRQFWGFNEDYLLGVNIFNLPIEEWLFFICIPYACIFTHIAVLKINPGISLSKSATKRISIGLLFLFTFLLLFNLDKAYTTVDMVFGLIVLAIVFKFKPDLLKSFYLTFLIMLIPFFIVNGILTGTGIEGEIVWYNNFQNLGYRLGTIPVEDVVYAFSLILMNLFLFDRFRNKSIETHSLHAS